VLGPVGKRVGKTISPSSLSCSWWMLPKGVQQWLKQFTGNHSWKLLVYKNPDDTWGFDLPFLLTFNEKFVNGTEKDFDWWYEQLSGNPPDLSSKLEVVVSSKELPDPTTVVEYIGDDDFDSFWNKDLQSIDKASYYLDQQSGYTIWLCQYLQFLFQEKPQKLYLKLAVKA
jgi:hypothetical protein